MSEVPPLAAFLESIPEGDSVSFDVLKNATGFNPNASMKSLYDACRNLHKNAGCLFKINPVLKRVKNYGSHGS